MPKPVKLQMPGTGIKKNEKYGNNNNLNKDSPLTPGMT